MENSIQISKCKTDSHQSLDRVVAYIQDHYASKIRLSELARVAGFSKFHFLRLFQARFGQNVRDYILRVRLEKAAFRITSGESVSVTEIAYACGFSCSQHLNRAFKMHFGLSPTEARKGVHNRIAKRYEALAGKYGRKHLLPKEHESGKEIIRMPCPLQNIENREEARILEVMQMPAYKVAYIRIRALPGFSEPGPYTEAFGKLFNRLAPNGLFESVFIVAAWSDLDPQGRAAYDLCFTVPDNFEDEPDEIRIKFLPGGEYAVYHGKFQDRSEIHDLWKKLYRSWWISSYFSRTVRPSLMFSFTHLSKALTGPWFFDLCLPITTLPASPSVRVPGPEFRIQS